MCVYVHVDFPVVFSLPEMANKVEYIIKSLFFLSAQLLNDCHVHGLSTVCDHGACSPGYYSDTDSTAKKLITGPPTHSVGGQTSNGRWCLSSSVGVCTL